MEMLTMVGGGGGGGGVGGRGGEEGFWSQWRPLSKSRSCSCSSKVVSVAEVIVVATAVIVILLQLLCSWRCRGSLCAGTRGVIGQFISVLFAATAISNVVIAAFVA